MSRAYLGWPGGVPGVKQYFDNGSELLMLMSDFRWCPTLDNLLYMVYHAGSITIVSCVEMLHTAYGALCHDACNYFYILDAHAKALLQMFVGSLN